MAFRHTKENCIYCKKRTAFFRKNGFCGCRLEFLKKRFLLKKKVCAEDNVDAFKAFAITSYASFLSHARIIKERCGDCAFEEYKKRQTVDFLVSEEKRKSKLIEKQKNKKENSKFKKKHRRLINERKTNIKKRNKKKLDKGRSKKLNVLYFRSIESGIRK